MPLFGDLAVEKVSRLQGSAVGLARGAAPPIALQPMKNLLPKRLVVFSTRSKSGLWLTADREDIFLSSPNLLDKIGFATRADLQLSCFLSLLCTL